LTTALAVFQKLGARIVEVDLPDTLAVMGDAPQHHPHLRAASYHEPFLATKAELYGPSSVRRDVEAGALITAGTVSARAEDAEDLREADARDFQGI
jgi:Asp-tRNA(Asn)/Glu-tRNA(Gln) amidotransferase A subunit family amidase